MHFFLKLAKTYQSNIIYPWAMSLPYLSVSVSHSCLQRCPLTLCDPPGSPHMVPGCARPAQPVDNPTTSSSPRDRLTSFLLCLRSLPFSSYLHWAPLPFSVREAPSARPNPKPASTPPNPSLLKPPRLLLRTHISTAGSNTCSLTSLPVVRNAHPPPESNPFACILLVFVQRFCAFYVCWKKAVGLPFAFWRCSRLPQLRLYFQWQVVSGHLIWSRTHNLGHCFLPDPVHPVCRFLA